jgi:transcriptional regulator with XRE-family HTH domain
MHILLRLREAKGWSQEAFADNAGVHRNYVSDIERGARDSDHCYRREACGAVRVEGRVAARLIQS